MAPCAVDDRSHRHEGDAVVARRARPNPDLTCAACRCPSRAACSCRRDRQDSVRSARAGSATPRRRSSNSCVGQRRHGRAAARARAPHVRQRDVRPVVVVEILRRQQAHRLQPFRLEQRRAVGRSRAAPDRPTTGAAAARPRSRPRAASRGDSARSSRRRTRVAGRPSACAASSKISIGVSQMPMSRAPVSWCTACVTMLTGFVKLISHAAGRQPRDQPRRTRPSAGMVRTAIANPAGPTVSWPTTPCAMAVASSCARCSAPPTRMLVMTKSAPSIAGFGRRDAVTATPPATRPRDRRSPLPRRVDVEEGDALDRQIGTRRARRRAAAHERRRRR